MSGTPNGSCRMCSAYWTPLTKLGRWGDLAEFPEWIWLNGGSAEWRTTWEVPGDNIQYVHADLYDAKAAANTAEVERLKQRVGELEGLLGELDSRFADEAQDHYVGYGTVPRWLTEARDKVRQAFSCTPERGECGAG